MTWSPRVDRDADVKVLAWPGPLSDDGDLAHVPTCREAITLYERRLATVRRQLAVLSEVETTLARRLRLLRTHRAEAS